MDENYGLGLLKFLGDDHPIYRSGVVFIPMSGSAARDSSAHSGAILRALAGERLTGEDFDMLANSPNWQPIAGRMDVAGVRLFGTVLEQRYFHPSRISQNGLLQVARLHWPDAQSVWLVLLIPMSDRPLVAQCADLSGTLLKMGLPVEKTAGGEVAFPLNRPDLLMIETDWHSEMFGEFQGRDSDALRREDDLQRKLIGSPSNV